MNVSEEYLDELLNALKNRPKQQNIIITGNIYEDADLNGDGVDDAFDHLRVAHSSNTTVTTNVGNGMVRVTCGMAWRRGRVRVSRFQISNSRLLAQRRFFCCRRSPFL